MAVGVLTGYSYRTRCGTHVVAITLQLNDIVSLRLSRRLLAGIGLATEHDNIICQFCVDEAQT